jgi:hypothetical protein
MVMSKRQKQRGFTLQFAMGALILLSLQAIVYILILDDTIGGVSFGARPVEVVPDLRAVVLRSGPTAHQWQSPEAHEARIRTWTTLLDQEAVSYAVVPETGLSEGLKGASVLILPGASCLGEAERDAVDAFLAAGGGVVAAGPVGTRDGECDWLGWDLVTSLSGAEAATAAVLEGGAFATFRGDQFYAGRLPAGYRLALPSQELTVIDVRSPDAYWSDWRLRPARGSRISGCSLAAHRIHESGARSVWFGFEESSFGRDQAEQQSLEGYLLSAVLWAGRQPTASLASWPSAASSSAMVNVIVDDWSSAERLASVLEESGARATFAVSSSAPGGELSRFSNAGEIAVRGDEREPLAGQEIAEQRQRLAVVRETLESSAGRPVEGLWPAEGVTDHLTPRAMDEAGLRYSMGEVRGIRGTPELVPRPRLLFPRPFPGVVRIFQSASDDLEVAASHLDGGGESIVRGFLWDFERIHYLGGVYPLTLHAGLLGPVEQERVLSRMLDRFGEARTWMATGAELSSWWGARSQLQVRVSQVSPYRLQVDVSNQGQADVRDVSALVYLPRRPESLALRSPVFRLSPPGYSLLPGEPVLRLDFEELARQTNYSYMVVLDE